MRSRASIFGLALTGLLLVVDPVAAAHAGPAPALGASIGAAPAAITPGPIAAPVHGISTPKHPTPVHGALQRRRSTPALSRHRTHPPTNLTPTAPVQGSAVAAPGPTARPEQPPSMCALVTASVAWPRGWRKVCAAARPGLLGLTNPNGTTTFFVRSNESASTMHVVALHEAGHAWDFARLDKAKIVQWCAQRGCNAGHFFAGGSGGVGWGQPGGAEDWAAVWDACHGGDYHRSYLGLAAPTPADCARQNALVAA